VDVRIEPEPEREERKAIEIALRRLLARGTVPAAYTSAWRTAGLRDAVDPDYPYTARRST